MNYTIREIKENEYFLLKDFLYEAIFQPDEKNLLPKDIINNPELKVYIDNFGLKDDSCLVAEVNGKVVGAVWTRIIKGYGNVNNSTPEFAVSLYKPYRGYGIGTELMKEMLKLLKKKGYKKASLSVQKENYAFNMYKKLGFKIVDENSEEYIMIYNLN